MRNLICTYDLLQMNWENGSSAARALLKNKKK